MWIETEYRQVNAGRDPEICLSPLSFFARQASHNAHQTAIHALHGVIRGFAAAAKHFGKGFPPPLPRP